MSIFGAVIFIAVMGWALNAIQRSSYVTQAGVAREQPVQFSHAHHAGGLGIDCRYCHTSVEVSSFAGIPPTRTCMNCHSMIWNQSPYLEPVRESFRTGKSLIWTRVNDLPDFVYFNHSIHVNKGIGCDTCHGKVNKMPLMYQQESLAMEWCINCHRHPEQYIRPKEEVFNMDYQPPDDQEALGRELTKKYNIQSVTLLTSCSTCHR
ncbi:MAG TPA: cytochrome c3 family protein [Bryobacteraceae bacterium]|nr:cytochrome c3 family protein [Bryobacteraceae bacterium]